MELRILDLTANKCAKTMICDRQPSELWNDCTLKRSAQESTPSLHLETQESASTAVCSRALWPWDHHAVSSMERISEAIERLPLYNGYPNIVPSWTRKLSSAAKKTSDSRKISISLKSSINILLYM